MWVPAFACPACRATVPDVPGVCATCGARYAVRDGILRFASDERLSEFAAFLSQYLAVRHADGHVPDTADEYRALPNVSRSHPAAVEWRIRRRSLETLQRLSLGAAPPMRVLDLGAGNGWLSHQITRRGHDAVAVDLNDDAGDGLAACRAYAAPFPVVQADFDDLPFMPGQFDLAVMNASLHYSQNPEQTLLGVAAMLAPGGALVVMDSPMFADAADGEAMVARQLEVLRATPCRVPGAGPAPQHLPPGRPLRQGVGFLTFNGLQSIARRLGRGTRFVVSRGPLLWQLRRSWSRRAIGRQPAMFGVWVAQ